MDNAIKILGEWKERILFVIVVLLALMIVTKAQWLGDGIEDVYSEEYTGSIKAVGIDPGVADDAIKMLESPPDIAPDPPNPSEVDRIHFNERKRYPADTGGWMLAQKQYEAADELDLDLPGYSLFADFDAPAGESPRFTRIRGVVPRDARPVKLSAESTREFED